MINILQIQDVELKKMISKIFHFTFFKINKIIIHSKVIPTFYEMNGKHDFNLINENEENYTLSLIRSSRQYLGSPYGQCSDYRDSDSKSRQLCYRKCFRNNYVKTSQCIPLFVDYYISELDSIPNTTQLCLKNSNNETFKEYETKIREKCMKFCPKECLREEYSYRITESNSKSGIDYWLRLE